MVKCTLADMLGGPAVCHRRQLTHYELAQLPSCLKTMVANLHDDHVSALSLLTCPPDCLGSVVGYRQQCHLQAVYSDYLVAWFSYLVSWFSYLVSWFSYLVLWFSYP